MPRRPPKIGQNPKFSTSIFFQNFFPWGVWWRFSLRQNLLFWAKIEVENFQIWTNLEKIFIYARNTIFQNFSPLASLGANKKVRKFFKAKGKPIPPLSSPEIELNARSRPECYASAAAQNWPKPEIFNLKIFSNDFSHDVYDDVFC